MPGLDQHIHIVTLVIKRERDIPLVRSKAKILAELCGFPKIKRVKIALAASELARFLLHHTRGGKASLFIVCKFEAGSKGPSVSGMELNFQGRSSCIAAGESSAPEEAGRVYAGLFQSLQTVMDDLEFQSCQPGRPMSAKAVMWGGTESCENLQKKYEEIKKQLFSDIEESFLENLRAKHEEVLELLRTLSKKNMELDKANTELLGLSQDMESLVHERTVVELALRIADKIRNPATVIGGLARIVLKKIPGDFSERPKIEAIFREAQKLEEIVKDFEGLAREQERFFVEIDLRALVEEILDAWHPHLEQKGLKLVTNFVETSLKIHADPRILKVAILHVLKNAVDASPHGASLEIGVSRINGRPVLSVKDYGPGIPPEIKEKLFKELVTTKPSGTGVGLIMVHHIMKEHQGEIEIESRPGLGTTVRLIFPERWKEKTP
jgi:signal transduction histidine kinase